MIDCPNCGAANPEASRFCSNCGASLAAVAPVSAGSGEQTAPSPRSDQDPDGGFARPSPMPPPVELPAARRPASDPEWRMSDPGPLPPPRGRRKWLWIAVGVLGACLLVCVASVIWFEVSGRDMLCDARATEVAEAAGSPTADDDMDEAVDDLCDD